MAHPPSLVTYLEKPYTECAPNVPVRDVILMALRWPTPTDYWPALAIGWLDQGAPIDQDIMNILSEIVEKKKFSQNVRHRAAALARKWKQEYGAS
jgi:hypothetical protein